MAGLQGIKGQIGVWWRMLGSSQLRTANCVNCPSVLCYSSRHTQNKTVLLKCMPRLTVNNLNICHESVFINFGTETEHFNNIVITEFNTQNIICFTP